MPPSHRFRSHLPDDEDVKATVFARDASDPESPLFHARYANQLGVLVKERAVLVRATERTPTRVEPS